MEKVTTIELLEMFKAKKYVLNETPYYPNLYGIRKNTNVPNKFDDFIGALWKDKKGQWLSCCYNGTTDPGEYYLSNPMNVKGTAIIVPNQYIEVYKIGTHTGYPAYQQVKSMTYIRDNNKNKILDWLYKIAGFKSYTEIAATNLHHANGKTKSQIVANWSAGCQVIADPNEYASLLKLGQDSTKSKTGFYYNYALFEETDIVKSTTQCA